MNFVNLFVCLLLFRINPRYKSNRYRYVYGIGLSAKAASQEGQIWDAIVKSVRTYAFS